MARTVREEAPLRRPIVTLLTDFGFAGGYVGSMKGVILGRADAELVDITHDVPPQSVQAGAFILRSVIPYFPKGTVHTVVIDPGVGTPRKPIAIRSGGFFFVGPDNGVLIPAAKSCGRPEVREINTGTIQKEKISNTFHGRDVFAPAAAYLASGSPFEKIGATLRTYHDMSFGEMRKVPLGLAGMSVYADGFGNIITNIRSEDFTKLFRVGDKLSVSTDSVRQVVEFGKTYSDVSEGSPVALVGSHGNVELAVSRGSAEQLFNCSFGTEIVFKKLKF